MYVRIVPWVWTILIATLTSAVVVVPDRTVAEREATCAERESLSTAFFAGDTSVVFKKMYAKEVQNWDKTGFSQAVIDKYETECVHYSRPGTGQNSVHNTRPCDESNTNFHWQYFVNSFGVKELRSVGGPSCPYTLTFFNIGAFTTDSYCAATDFCALAYQCDLQYIFSYPPSLHIVPVRCGCGFEMKPKILPSTSSYDRLGYECEDWDECQEDHGCPPFSTCVNTLGSYNCECIDGYHIAGNPFSSVGSYQDTCVLDGIETAAVEFTFSTIRVQTVNSAVQIANFRVTLGVWETPYKLVIPDRNAVKVVTRAQAESASGVFYNNLNPGTEYTVTFQPLDAALNELPAESIGSQNVLTTCSCDSGDGRPEDLVVEQQDGFVLFSFIDKSTCDEAFAFARRMITNDNTTGSDEDVFTPNYYYFASGASLCKSVPYKPGKAASDDLSVSRLEIGRTYEYCVRGISPRISYTTEYTCTPHRIRWEASLAGAVRLSPEAGGLPVRDVFVSYSLYSAENEEVRNGTTKTGSSGEFNIAFNDDLPSFTINSQFRLHLSFSKVTSGVTHTFLCREGTVDCTQRGTDVYLEHLRFRQPIQVIDDTSLPFSGLVVVGNTTADDSLKGCPIVGAQVCLVDFAARSESVEPLCTTTDNTGRYSLPAVIGLRVTVSVSYFNHTFRVLDPAKQEAHEKGVVIEPDGIYEDNDYVDVQTAEIITEVAGGLCNRILGVSKVRVKIANCPNWDGMLLQQADYRDKHRVPAHDLLVTTEEVVGHLAATDILSLVTKRLDLTSSAESPDNTPEQAAEDVESLELVRFQFNGTMQVGVRIRFEEDQTCDATAVDPAGVVGADTTSLHVVPLTVNLYLATISFSQFLGTEISNCDHLDADTPLTITNGLGLVAGSQLDQDYRKVMEEELNAANLALMEVCNTGCSNISIVHDVIGNVTRNARAILPFRIPRPNKTPPFTKYLDIQLGGLSPLTHRAVVVVTGNFNNGKVFSVGLPTYKPLLVLRDPPGGLSYSYYKNMRSVVRLKMEDYKVWGGVVHNLDISLLADNHADACIGGGAIVLTIFCQQVLEGSIRGTGTSKGESDFLGTLDHEEYGAEYTLEWSYETSKDIWLAGQASDAFLVPNLNVIFTLYDVISFDINTCLGSSTQETFFDLNDVANEPAVAFYSRYAIERQELPQLLRLSEEYAQRILNTTDPGEIAEYTQNKDAADDAYAAWSEFLNDYITTTEDINNGNVDKVAPHHWFDAWASTVDKGENEPSMSGLWTGMVPKSLADRSEPRSVPWESQQREEGPDELEKTHLIKFSGGASLLKFEMKHGKTEEHITKLGRPEQNSNSHQTFSANAAKGFKVYGKGVRVAVTGGFDVRVKHDFLQTDKTEDSTRVGFVLGDGDAGDLFDVQVHFDPLYGTFAFNTVAGKSKCPYEINTRRREAAKLQVFAPDGPVLPDDPMIFRLLITNEGEDLSSFQLSVDHRTNPGMLVHSINGDTLTVPQQYDRIEAGQTVSTSLSIYRGPELYDYPPLKLAVQSSCEAIRNFGDGNLIGLLGGVTKVFRDAANQNGRIVFTQPCHPISWAGSLERDGTFVSNAATNAEVLKVVLQNEGALSFADAVAESRLTKIELVYRRKHDNAWIVASGRAIGETAFNLVDLAADGIEDEFGFAAIEWQLPIFDGDYEVAARSVCEPSGEAELDTFMTPVISGTVDRVRPEPFGLPSPSFREVFSTDEFSFRFTEAIDCARPYSFRFDVTFAGLSLAYETNELRVICDSSEGKISFMLPSSAEVDQLLGRSISIGLSNVQDLAGNDIASPVTLQATYHNFNASSDLVFFRLVVDTSCTSSGLNQNQTVSSLVNELAQLLLVDAARIEISGLGCLSPGQLTAIVRIVPVEEGSASLRRLQGSQTGLELYWQIKDLNLSSLTSAFYPYLSNAYLDASTFEVVDEVSGPGASRDAEVQAVQITRPVETAGIQSLEEKVTQMYDLVVIIGCVLAVGVLAIVAVAVHSRFWKGRKDLANGLDEGIAAAYESRKSERRAPNPLFQSAESIHADTP